MFELAKPPAIIRPAPKEIIRPGDPRFGAGMIINPYVFGPPPLAPRSVSYLAAPIANAGNTTYNINSVSFGTAHADRFIIVAGVAQGTNDFVSATIGGVSASVAVTSVSSLLKAAIVYANVPTGTTGTVSFTWGGAQSRMAIGVWRCQFAGLVHHAGEYDTIATGTAQSKAIATLADGFVIGAGMSNHSSATTYAWTNVTERYEGQFGGSRTHSGGDGATVGGSLTVSVAMNQNSGEKTMVLASF